MANLTFELSELKLPSLVGRDLSTLYKLWAEDLESATIQSFQSESTYAGTPWQPLTQAWIDRRDARKSPPTRGKILRDTGGLYDSIYARPVSDGAVVGSNQMVGKYSLLAIHQFGAPRRNIPARPVLPMDQNGDLLPGMRQQLIDSTRDFFIDQKRR